MVRLVLFDIDGTLIRTGGAGVQAFERTLASVFNVQNGTARVKFAGRVDPSIIRECFAHHQIAATPENFRHFFACYVFWLDPLLHQFQGGPCAGVWRFIRGLQALPQPPVLGLLTGNIRLGAEIKLRHYGLWELFATGAFGDDHEHRRQLAVIARERGSRLLGRPLRGDEVLVVGDTPHDIDCARAIEAKTLAVATGGASLEDLKAHHPTWFAEEMTQVTAEEVCA